MNEPIIYDYTPHNLPEDMLRAIGLVTAAAAQTESVFEMAIAGMLGVENDFGLAVTTHMAAPLREKVFYSIAEIRFSDAETLNRLDDLAKAIHEAGKLRNSYVHQSYKVHPNGTVYMERIRSESSLEITSTPITVEEIQRDAEIINQAGLKLMQFLGLRNLLPPFAPADRPRGHTSKAARKDRRKKHSGFDGKG